MQIAILRGRPIPPLNPRGGRLGLPADFLIAGDGRVVACRCGVHVADHWSADELIGFAGSEKPSFEQASGQVHPLVSAASASR